MLVSLKSPDMKTAPIKQVASLLSLAMYITLNLGCGATSKPETPAQDKQLEQRCERLAQECDQIKQQLEEKLKEPKIELLLAIKGTDLDKFVTTAKSLLNEVLEPLEKLAGRTSERIKSLSRLPIPKKKEVKKAQKALEVLETKLQQTRAAINSVDADQLEAILNNLSLSIKKL